MNNNAIGNKRARLMILAEEAIAHLLDVCCGSFKKTDPRYVQLQDIILKGGLSPEDFIRADARARNEYRKLTRVKKVTALATVFTHRSVKLN